MAASLPLEEEQWTCAICFEPYQQPQSLRCGHVFCTPCLDSAFIHHPISKTIDCSICREPSKRMELRRDYTMQSLVERMTMMKVGTSDTPNRKGSKPGQIVNCEQCNTQKWGYFCEECNMYLCQECKHAHSIVPTTKLHTIRDTYYLKQPKVHRLQNLKAKYQEHLQWVSERNREINTKHLGFSEQRVLTEIEALSQAVLNKVEDLKKQVHSRNDNMRKSLEELEVALKSEVDILDDAIINRTTETLLMSEFVDKVEDIVKENDNNINQLKANLKDFDSDTICELQVPTSFAESLEQICVLHKPIVKKRKISPGNVTAATAKQETERPPPPVPDDTLHLGETDQKRGARAPPVPPGERSFACFLGEELHQEEILPLNDNFRSLSIISNQLWVHGANAIHVFDVQTREEVRLLNIYRSGADNRDKQSVAVERSTQISSGLIAVVTTPDSSDKNNRLYEIEEASGYVTRKLTRGKIEQINTSGNQLIMMETDVVDHRCHFRIFQHDGSKWQNSGTFYTSYLSPNLTDDIRPSFLMYQQSIYFCNTRRIFLYSITGTHEATLPLSLSDDGNDHILTLCDIDHHGNCLMIEKQNLVDASRVAMLRGDVPGEIDFIEAEDLAQATQVVVDAHAQIWILDKFNTTSCVSLYTLPVAKTVSKRPPRGSTAVDDTNTQASPMPVLPQKSWKTEKEDSSPAYSIPHKTGRKQPQDSAAKPSTGIVSKMVKKWKQNDPDRSPKALSREKSPVRIPIPSTFQAVSKEVVKKSKTACVPERSISPTETRIDKPIPVNRENRPARKGYVNVDPSSDSGAKGVDVSTRDPTGIEEHQRKVEDECQVADQSTKAALLKNCANSSDVQTRPPLPKRFIEQGNQPSYENIYLQLHESDDKTPVCVSTDKEGTVPKHSIQPEVKKEQHLIPAHSGYDHANRDETELDLNSQQSDVEIIEDDESDIEIIEYDERIPVESWADNAVYGSIEGAKLLKSTVSAKQNRSKKPVSLQTHENACSNTKQGAEQEVYGYADSTGQALSISDEDDVEFYEDIPDSTISAIPPPKPKRQPGNPGSSCTSTKRNTAQEVYDYTRRSGQPLAFSDEENEYYDEVPKNAGTPIRKTRSSDYEEPNPVNISELGDSDYSN